VFHQGWSHEVSRVPGVFGSSESEHSSDSTKSYIICIYRRFMTRHACGDSPKPWDIRASNLSVENYENAHKNSVRPTVRREM